MDDGKSPADVFTTTGFELLLDGQSVALDTVIVESNSVNWIFNFPDGLTGSHTFLGVWTEFKSGSQGEAQKMEIKVNFIP